MENRINFNSGESKELEDPRAADRHSYLVVLVSGREAEGPRWA